MFRKRVDCAGCSDNISSSIDLALVFGVNGGAVSGNPDMLALALPGAGDLLFLTDRRCDLPPGDTISEDFDRPGDSLLLTRGPMMFGVW